MNLTMLQLEAQFQLEYTTVNPDTQYHFHNTIQVNEHGACKWLLRTHDDDNEEDIPIQVIGLSFVRLGFKEVGVWED